MAFSNTRKTFLQVAGRLGTPMGRKPSVSNSAKRQNIFNGAISSKKPTAKPIGKAKVVKNGAPLKTSKAKGTINSYRMSKAPKLNTLTQQDLKNSNFYMGKKPRGTNPKQDAIDSRLGSYFSGIKAPSY